MKVVVDNNVIVDALKPNPKFVAEAREILRLASLNEIDAWVSANSLTDVFYVLRKQNGMEKTKAQIIKLLGMLSGIISVEPDDCVAALEQINPDFEDALIDTCAKKAGADCIVSRDEAFIKANNWVQVITPSQLLEKMNGENHGQKFS